MGTDPIDEYMRQVDELVSDVRRLLGEAPIPRGGMALAMAREAGLKPQLCYTVSETALYSGVGERSLYREHEIGRLRFVMPNGAARGYCISVDEMDRWMEASQR